MAQDGAAAARSGNAKINSKAPRATPRGSRPKPDTVVAAARSHLPRINEEAAEAAAAEVEAVAMALDPVRAQLEGRTVRKVIVIAGKLINIVAN